MIRTFKTEIFPTAKQREYFHKAFGIRRWTWNWTVSEYFRQAKDGVYPHPYEIQKLLNNNVVGQPGFEWLSEVNSMVRGEAIKDFSYALEKWRDLQRQSRRSPAMVNPEKGKPRFKKKGKCAESFRLFAKSGRDVTFPSNHRISMVTVRGRKRLQLKTRESVEFLKDAVFKTCTVSFVAGKYFISITYEKTNRSARQMGTGTVGIDLGIKHVATCFDGKDFQVFDVPNNLKSAEKRTERTLRKFSRTQQGSARNAKLKLAVQRCYARECNIKRDFREKLTTWFVKNFDTVKIDCFSFASAKNLDINRALVRVSVYAFEMRLKGKAQERSVSIVEIPRGTPTTKTCSHCGAVQDVALSARTYRCPVCSFVLDRDKNAAVNVFNF